MALSDSPPLRSISLSVEVSCYSLPDERSSIPYVIVLGENVLVEPVIGDSARECCREDKLETFVDIMEGRPIIHRIDPRVVPKYLDVEIGYEGMGFTCQNTEHFLRARVTLSREFEPVASADSTIRLLLGIVFAIVWTIIMTVPVILWLRRRRAQAPEIAAQQRRLIRQATTRHTVRQHGVRTRPRRFKVPPPLCVDATRRLCGGSASRSCTRTEATMGARLGANMPPFWPTSRKLCLSWRSFYVKGPKA